MDVTRLFSCGQFIVAALALCAALALPAQTQAAQTAQAKGGDDKLTAGKKPRSILTIAGPQGLGPFPGQGRNTTESAQEAEDEVYH